jgi:hypothetical protein
MSSGMKIPAKTAQKLRVPAAPGLRHTQMTELILPLLGAGLTPGAIFTQFRAMYGPDLPWSDWTGHSEITVTAPDPRTTKTFSLNFYRRLNSEITNRQKEWY